MRSLTERNLFNILASFPESHRNFDQQVVPPKRFSLRCFVYVSCGLHIYLLLGNEGGFAAREERACNKNHSDTAVEGSEVWYRHGHGTGYHQSFAPFIPPRTQALSVRATTGILARAMSLFADVKCRTLRAKDSVADKPNSITDRHQE